MKRVYFLLLCLFNFCTTLHSFANPLSNNEHYPRDFFGDMYDHHISLYRFEGILNMLENCDSEENFHLLCLNLAIELDAVQKRASMLIKYYEDSNNEEGVRNLMNGIIFIEQLRSKYCSSLSI